MLFSLTQLTSLELINNKIGEGAKNLASLTKLTSLNLDYNNVSDTILNTLSELTKLQKINLGK